MIMQGRLAVKAVCARNAENIGRKWLERLREVFFCPEMKQIVDTAATTTA